MHAETHHELTFRTDLHVIGRFGPGLFRSPIFLHVHAAGIQIGLGVAAVAFDRLRLLFILLQPHQAIPFQLIQVFAGKAVVLLVS